MNVPFHFGMGASRKGSIIGTRRLLYPVGGHAGNANRTNTTDKTYGFPILFYWKWSLRVVWVVAALSPDSRKPWVSLSAQAWGMNAVSKATPHSTLPRILTPAGHIFISEKLMHKTIRCFIDENRQVRLLENVELPAGKNALITILDTDDATIDNESAYLSEAALGKDWNRVEEDKAWSGLSGET
jgi:hypothetical protein